MPIYVFGCEKCGKEFEELVGRMGATVPCPACGSKKVTIRPAVTADYRNASAAEARCPSCPEMPMSQCPGGMCSM